jgi:RNA polymerase sigma factor (sigma-70 family)
MTDRLHRMTSVEDLLALARQGDAEAENALFTRIHARILAVAKKRIWDSEAALDVVQDTMRTVLEKYREADLPAGLFPWLFTILHHKVGNYVKRRRAEVKRLDPREHSAGMWEQLAITEESASFVELTATLEKGLRELPAECQRIFRLLLEGAGRQEIRDAFGGGNQGTIDSRISRCRARLLAYLEAQGTEGRGR